MTRLKSLIPDASAVIDMDSADLAGYVFEALMSSGEMERGNWNRGNFCMEVGREYADPRQPLDQNIGIACSAAWTWLETNGFICRHPEQDNWYVPTPKGRSARNHQQIRQYISGLVLPQEFLHPELLVNVRPLFLQARFETSVFEAFKALEVAIRNAAELGHDMIGVQLASKAFHPEDGVLTDRTAEKGERVALMSLMTGALGSYKNPASHRRVEITAEEARDMVVLASHLLKIVDGRSAARS
jgi:uncharacterized protein (TIGR02391 family)